MKTNLRFKALPANSPELFSENIFNRIAECHPVRLVNEVVNQLKIDPIIQQYKGGGTTSYDPRMLIKVLFYAYLSNIYSCRKIEKALEENIYFMWLSGNSTPDFRTINYFRGKRLKGNIQQLFADVVRLLQAEGYVSLKVQYIDGTKIESAAGRYTFVWKGSVEKNKTKLEAKIQSVLSDIEGQIKTDQADLSPEQPKTINSAALKAKLSELNSRLKETTKEYKNKSRPCSRNTFPASKSTSSNCRSWATGTATVKPMKTPASCGSKTTTCTTAS